LIAASVCPSRACVWRPALAGHGHDVVAELLGIGLCHGDILPPEAETSEVRCQPNSGQTRSAPQRVHSFEPFEGLTVLGIGEGLVGYWMKPRRSE
jgi:hypothetical protein